MYAMSETRIVKWISDEALIGASMIFVVFAMLLAVASPTLMALYGGRVGNQQAKLDSVVAHVVKQTNNDKTPTSAREVQRDVSVAIRAVTYGVNGLGVVQSKVTSSSGRFTVARAWSASRDCIVFDASSRRWSYTTGVCRS